MTPSELNLRALPVRDLVRRSIAACEAIWGGETLNWTLHTNVGNHGAQGTTQDIRAVPTLAELFALADNNDFVICTHFEVVRIFTNSHRESFTYRTTNGFLASIGISTQPNPSRAFAIAEALRKHFEFLPLDALTKKLAEPAEVSALQLREAAVADLHAQTSKLMELIATIPERDLELRAKRNADLEQEYQARSARFEANRTAALDRDELERKAKADEIAAKDAELQKRIAEHDARESKLVRRDLLEKLTKLLDDFGKFELSEATSKKRSPVKWAVWFTAAVFLILGGYGAWNYLSTRDVHYLPASVSGLVGFSAAMLYYVKWSDTWFRQHADEEMQSKRYKADMLRASWIAELAAEWVKEGKDAPPELLAVFAKNLFMTNTGVPEVEHPADAILGLLKRAQKLDVAKDRVTVEAGPR